MGFGYTTTAAPNESSIVRGNVAFVSGHWTTTFGTAQTIVTGGTEVLFAFAQAASTVSSIVGIVLNADAYGTATDGNIQLKPGTPSQSGTWAAIVRVNGTI